MSLLEALAVLAIVGLIGSIAYPRMEQAYQVVTLHHSANLLVRDLRLARASALRSGVAATVRPVREGRGYALPDETVRDLPDGISLRLGSNGDGVRFFPDGAASGGPSVVAGASRGMEIAVNPATGTVAPVEP